MSATLIRLAPGLALVLAGVAVGAVVNGLLPALPLLTSALLVGVVLGNVVALPERTIPGLKFVTVRVLRLGIILLGLRLSVNDLVAVGLPGLGLVLVLSGATLWGVQALGRRMGVGPDIALLLASGFAICGGSAIVAVSPFTDADEGETAYALSVVVAAGTLMLLVLTVLATLDVVAPALFGVWVGASLPDVGQTIATAAAAGPDALDAAVLVKLTRVVLLLPLLVALSIRSARQRKDSGTDDHPVGAVVPWFVVGFLMTLGIRTAGVLPTAVFDVANTVRELAFAAALFGLGTAVRFAKLRAIGGRPLLLGWASAGLLSAAALVGATLITRFN